MGMLGVNVVGRAEVAMAAVWCEECMMCLSGLSHVCVMLEVGKPYRWPPGSLEGE